MKNFSLALFFTLFFCLTALSQDFVPLKIIENPIPQLTEAQRKANVCAQGTVTLRVEFLANGQIGEVSFVSGLPYGLSENAVEAAKKIKFEPAIKGGNATSIFKQVQYSFTSVGGWKNRIYRAENSNIVNYNNDEKAEAVLRKAVEKLGGEKYLNVKSQIGRGKFSGMRDGAVITFQSFTDVLIFPDRERTEFKGGGTAKTVQTNTGETGWIFDGEAQTVKDQGAAQIENFKRGIRVSLDNLLRGNWRKDAALTYLGKRPATLGKRNDAVKLTYSDGLAIEYEFSDEGLPVKAMYKRTDGDGAEIKEEDRYAQFIEIQGIKTPFIIDRFTNAAQTSRINYESVEYDKPIPDQVFAKPKNAKEAKKDLKF